LCVALACDVRVASQTADLGLTFTKLGLHPGMGITHFLTKTVRPDVAAQLLMTGDVVRGAQAKELGLVTSLDEKPVDKALEIASAIAQQPPAGISTWFPRYVHKWTLVSTPRSGEKRMHRRCATHQKNFRRK